MSWSSPPTAFVDEALERLKRVHNAAFLEVKTSLTIGSDITGAKGQPVDEFNLRESFIEERPSDYVSEVSTNAAYAQSIEDGINYGNLEQGYLPTKPMQLRYLRGPIGQFHNREATIQGWGAIVEHALETTP